MSPTAKTRVWVIIGDSDAGKSTIIGHLASHFGKGEMGVTRYNGRNESDILLRAGGLQRTFVKRSALQETPINATKFIGDMAAKVPNILICLRFLPQNNCGSAHEYLSSFVGAGWDIQSIVLLPPFTDAPRYRDFGAPVLEMAKKPEPINTLGHRIGAVRNHFGWA